MSYQNIDATLNAWVQKHNLFLYTQYQDVDVRSIEIVSTKGVRYQIWVDEPRNGIVAVHAWDYKKRRLDLEGSIDDLSSNLEKAMDAINGWMK